MSDNNYCHTDINRRETCYHEWNNNELLLSNPAQIKCRHCGATKIADNAPIEQKSDMQDLQEDIDQLRKDFQAFKLSDAFTRVSAAQCYQAINHPGLEKKIADLQKELKDHIEYTQQQLNRQVDENRKISRRLDDTVNLIPDEIAEQIKLNNLPKDSDFAAMKQYTRLCDQQDIFNNRLMALEQTSKDVESDMTSIDTKPGMTLMKAIHAMSEGHAVKRKEWHTSFTLSKGFGAGCGLDWEDLIATDWEIVE